MFRRIRRRRKQQRPQHWEDLASESEASFSDMNDRGGPVSDQSTADEEVVSGGSQLGTAESNSSSSDYDDDFVTSERREFGAVRPGSSLTIRNSGAPETNVGGSRCSRTENAANEDRRFRGGNWPPVDERRNESLSSSRLTDRGSCRSSTGSPNGTGSCGGVIGIESHVTKLQSFVDSLANLTKPNGFCHGSGSSAPLESGSFRLLPRLKSLSAAPQHHQPGSNSARPYSSGLRSAPSAEGEEGEEEQPLDLSTKGSASKSIFKDRKYTDAAAAAAANPVEIQKLEIFERFRRSQVENLGGLRFFSPTIRQNDETRLNSNQLNSVASLAPISYVRDGTQNSKREKMAFEELRVDVTSHEVRSESFKAAEDNIDKRRLRGLHGHGLSLGSQENGSKKRKLSNTEGILKIERRNLQCTSSHQSSKYSSGSGGKRLDGGSDLNSADVAPDKTKMELLRAKCNCGRAFESLFQLAVHIQKSGHLPENRKPVPMDGDSAKPVYGQRGWITEVQRQTRVMLASHSNDTASPGRSDFGVTLEPAATDGNDTEDGKLCSRKDFESAAEVSSRFQSNAKDETPRKDDSEPARADETASVCHHLPPDVNGEQKSENAVKIIPTEDEEEVEKTQHCVPDFSAHDLTDEVNSEINQSSRPESVSKQALSSLSAEEHRLTGTSGTVCTSAQSNDLSVTTGDYLGSASYEKSRAMITSNERHEIGLKSRDRESDDERNPNGFGDKTQLRKRRFMNCSSMTNGTTRGPSENSETTKVTPITRIASDNSVTSDERSVSRQNHERNGVNPRTQEKERSFYSDVFQHKGYSPDRKYAETTRKEIARNNLEAQSLFVSSPASKQVDSSLSLLAMKNFVDKHFSDQDNNRLFTKVNVLSPRNYNRTTHEARNAVMTVRANAKTSDHRRSPSTKRLDVLFATNSHLPDGLWSSCYSQDKSHEVVGRPLVSSSASGGPAKRRRSEERTEDCGREPAESTVVDAKQLESSESLKSGTSEPLSSRRSQDPCSDQSTPRGGTKNGVTVVHAESGTGGMGRSTIRRDTEVENDVNSAGVISAQLKKSHPLEFKAKSLPPTETALSSSSLSYPLSSSISSSLPSSLSPSSISSSLSSSSYSKVDISGAMHATAPSSINHFRCKESLEQVC